MSGNKTNGLVDRFKALEPAKQRKFLIVGLALVSTLLLWGGYEMTHSGKAPVKKLKKGEKAVQSLAMDPQLLKRTKYTEQDRRLEQMSNELAALRKQVSEEDKAEAKEAAKAARAEERADGSAAKKDKGDIENLFKVPTFDELTKKGEIPEPPIPLPGGQSFPTPPGGVVQGPPAKATGAPAIVAAPEPIIIGEIVVSHNSAAKAEDVEAKADKKKAKGKQNIYLASGFMEATLLSGVDAPTSGSGKSNPVPMLIRIKAPGVLPNAVKSNLKGCFVVAEGVGDLAKERVDVRLLNLSCISVKDQAVIDQSIKGFVVDADGKVGLSGTVVSKMGSAVARAMIAGIFDGAGEALKSSSTTSALNGFGTATSVIDTNSLGTAALGGGLSSAAKEIQEFYLDLAKQTAPVIEIGAAKDITLVFTEGVELAIKEFDRIGE